MRFESFANSEGYKTVKNMAMVQATFESFANSEGYKTSAVRKAIADGLRALLIQKGTKPCNQNNQEIIV